VRRFTPIELALGVSLLGCIAAVAVPSFVREVHASRFVEPTDGLARLQASALAYAEANGRFPEMALQTPALPPRGKKEADPPGVWETPAWKALDFRAAPEGIPHAYSFSFEPQGAGFVARSRGDLDGDGILSTFEVRGILRPDQKPEAVPGMYVEAELE
jgi:type II secretory pathway pseudopilin PulG